MKVSWKQSSASTGPTEETRNRHTTSRWASRKRWKGGSALAHWGFNACSLRNVRSLSSRTRRSLPPLRGRAGPRAASRAQRRRRAVALLAVLVAQRLEHREHVVEADRIGPLERPARVAQAEHHAEVDVARLADAFAERERRLVDHLADDPPEHQPGRVADPRHVLAERREEALRALRRQRRGGLGARQLDERTVGPAAAARGSRPRCRPGRACSAIRARRAAGARRLSPWRARLPTGS